MENAKIRKSVRLDQPDNKVVPRTLIVELVSPLERDIHQRSVPSLVNYKKKEVPPNCKSPVLPENDSERRQNLAAQKHTSKEYHESMNDQNVTTNRGS